MPKQDKNHKKKTNNTLYFIVLPQMEYRNSLQAAEYIYNTIKKLDPEEDIVDKEQLLEILQEEILDTYELEMQAQDLDILEKNKNDKEFFDTYLKEKYDDYQDILTDIVNEIIS